MRYMYQYEASLTWLPSCSCARYSTVEDSQVYGPSNGPVRLNGSISTASRRLGVSELPTDVITDRPVLKRQHICPRRSSPSASLYIPVEAAAVPRTPTPRCSRVMRPTASGANSARCRPKAMDRVWTEVNSVSLSLSVSETDGWIAVGTWEFGP